MSLIAEFSIISPLVQEPLESVPEMVLYNEDVHMTPAGEGIRVFWASGDNFDAFESSLQASSTVKDYACLTEIDDRRLYRVTHPKETVPDLLYPKAAESDVGFLDVTTTHEESYFRARIPSLDTLRDVRDVCQKKGIQFHLHRLYREELDDPADQFELTAAQRDVLVRAHEQGYFNEPRNTTLEELAEEFEISSSALGRRMRRGLDTLIEHTIRSEPEDFDD
ncbi:helix-turn-helix domain-containing protein [Natrinema salinisoli]|uniref:helix-turn-helix domain-containing protein n=1 Tax=Natrinema salinisoli TaxID=2878535 RepID=UPI001CEFEBFB|nr:helix-turn-helix domain-containing protein [Natrinema salinisoli]